MLRPPQPAVYIFLLDVSRQAVETGYIKSVCDVMLDELDKLPGDSRTQVIMKLISAYKLCLVWAVNGETPKPVHCLCSILYINQHCYDY